MTAEAWAYPWSPATERDEHPDITGLRELIAHAAPLGADITVKDASPAVIAWVLSRGGTLGHANDFQTAYFIHASGVWVSAQCRKGERGWIEPEARAA